MIDLRDLPLATEEQRLDSFATLSRSDDARLRRRALTLVAELAPRGLDAHLTAIASDRDADGWSLTYALRALHRMGAELAPKTFRRMLGEAAGALERDEIAPSAKSVDPVDVALLAVSPALVEMTLTWIEGLTGDVIPKLLNGLTQREEEPPSEVVDALIARWVDEVPKELPSMEVELATRLANQHAAALDLLEKHWRPRAMKSDAAVADAVDRVPELARRLGDTPSLPALLHAELVGTHGSLADALGPLPFARRLRNAVLRWSARELPPRDEHVPSLYARYCRALRHLGRWEYGAAVVAHLLQRCTLAREVEADLAGVWLGHDRPAALAWIEARIRDASDSDLRARLANQLSWRARREDAPLLHRLLDGADISVRAAALRTLLRFEEGERWSATVRALATLRDDVGTVARWGLLHQGDEATSAALLEEAVSSSAASARDEALVRLAHVTRVVRAHRSLFEEALASPEHTLSQSALAVGLFNAFGDDAMPSVLRAYLSCRFDDEADGLRGLIVSRWQ